MGFYIGLGILVSLGLLALVWFTGDKKDDLAKWLVMVAIPVSGWAFWPFYALAAAGYFMRKRAMEQAREEALEKEESDIVAHRQRKINEARTWGPYARDQARKEALDQTHQERDPG